MNSTNTPTFEPINESKYPIPEGLQVKCGYVSVPEARSAASGRREPNPTLRIYVTVVKSLSNNPAPDPVVFLYGGPGGNSGNTLKRLGSSANQKAFLSRSDLIIFDQRGTGYSEPELFAPEEAGVEYNALLTSQDANACAEQYVEMVLNARKRFVDAGANLAAINTPEIVADMEDIRIAFGYEKLNLFGISYGTRPALAAMRDFPDSIRSVVLDSTVPIQVSQYVEAIPNANHAFELLFNAVAADPQASAAYPNLRDIFYDVFERLSKTPVQVAVKHPNTGEALTFHLKGDVFLGYFCFGFYSEEAITRMPKEIYQAYRGDYKPIVGELLSIFDSTPSGQPGHSIGMYFSVNCCDDKVDEQTAHEIKRHEARYPAMRSLALTEFHLGAHIAKIGEAWGARKAGPLESQPVVSEIPTLILAGQFDQNTPAYWGRLAGETLSNSHYIEFPGMGHGVIGQGDCAASLVSNFYADPLAKPEERCVRDLPKVQFLLPV